MKRIKRFFNKHPSISHLFLGITYMMVLFIIFPRDVANTLGSLTMFFAILWFVGKDLRF